MKYFLSISIVLYKTPVGDIEKILASLRNFSGSYHLYIIDNSPTNELMKILPSDLQFEYIHLPRNPGFGSAHNVAIRKAQLLGSEYHLVINADVKFDSDILTPMLAYMEEHPEIGQMMPKVLNPDGSVQRLCKLSPTPSDLLLRRFSKRKTADTNNRHFELHNSGYDRIMFVPYLSGCFMLLRQSALREIGLFDERFFMYPEDIDLTRRMAERYETIFFPHVSVVHEHGAASYKSLKMLIIHIVNISRYFNKWGWFYDPIRDSLNKRTLDQFSNK
ncbi:glycosyltransferase family 2 protein [Pandoraea sp.]|uniref:glycosyltransferase family 2 protein n=1 Tax=Pandoraea sp. TaxID=1883445 RepID=UPI0035B02BA3